VASTSFFVIRITDDTLLPKYAAWFLNHPDTQEFLKGKAKGTSMPSIKKADLEELEIPVPSLEKQQLIIQLGALSRREAELRHEILSKRQQIVNQQIINAIKG
jgi:restriction endonuclease S subunit